MTTRLPTPELERGRLPEVQGSRRGKLRWVSRASCARGNPQCSIIASRLMPEQASSEGPRIGPATESGRLQRQPNPEARAQRVNDSVGTRTGPQNAGHTPVAKLGTLLACSPGWAVHLQDQPAPMSCNAENIGRSVHILGTWRWKGNALFFSDGLPKQRTACASCSGTSPVDSRGPRQGARRCGSSLRVA